MQTEAAAPGQDAPLDTVPVLDAESLGPVVSAVAPGQTGKSGSASDAADDPPAIETPAEDPFDRSTEARIRRLRAFGGDARSEDAVEAGLRWLAAHQSEDGTWRRVGFQDQCPDSDRCLGTAYKRMDVSLRTGLTGLATLAFLGAGYTDRDGPYQDTVRRATAALLRDQRPDGGFSRSPNIAGYNDALATLAVAELYAMTRDERLRRPLVAAVDNLVRAQQPLGGWDYVLRPDSGRNDTSITAWAVQALHTAAVAGVRVPRAALIRASLHFQRAAEPDGQVRYADADIGFKLDQETLQPVYRYGGAMTACGLTCEEILGWRPDAPLRRKQITVLFSDPPSATRALGGDTTQLHSLYYWYYGTLAMFQIGGDEWKRWNASLRDALLPLQDRRVGVNDRRPHTYGSWNPYGRGWGKWGRMGGRVYSTALATLTLEIYYRHTPTYLDDRVVAGGVDWETFLRGADDQDRVAAVAALSNTRIEVAEPALLSLTGDESVTISADAARVLAQRGSPAGESALRRGAAQGPGWQRAQSEAALRRITDILSGPPTRGKLRRFEPMRSLATLDLPNAWAGMTVTIERAGAPIGKMCVIRRFEGRDVVVAELLESTETPAAGDDVRELR
ncbi:MAG: hypothetical protein KDA32_04070 [Phycisphaerales bacterium]|nr:hypothetical protein [Phycisphaerales bacterium]